MILPIPDGLPAPLVLEFSTQLFKTVLFHVTFLVLIFIVR